MNIRKAFLVPLLFILCGGLFVFCNAGCSKVEKKTPLVKTEEPPPARPAATSRIAVYYLKMTDTDAYLVREEHNIPQSKDLMMAAAEELIHGRPTTPGASRVLPGNAKIRGIKVANGLATIDFTREVLHANVGSSGEALGIQSIVNTLTEFPDVKKVSFTVEGGIDERAREWWGHVGLYEQPFLRNISEVREPVIWVTNPKPGARVAGPLTVRGTAMVFEATLSLRLVTRDGQKLVEKSAMATAGAPERGTFETVLNFTSPAAGEGYVEALWYSPKDGSELDKVRVPVKF